ncbi:MAG: hypothetical protein ABSF70_16900 [Terracidiphilus sp.]|jgi:hypothetical protein
MSAAAALVVAAALAGCGSTIYFAGRTLPPSGLANRVLIAIQNPNTTNTGTLLFVDAFYDIRYRYNSANVGPAFAISGYSGNLPISIQNLPEQQAGAVYGSGDGSFVMVNYAGETASGGNVSGLNGFSSSVYVSRNESYVVAASQGSHVMTVINRGTGGSYPLSLPGVYRVSLNPAGSVALAFVQNSNYVYYPRQLTAAQTIAYSGGPSTWPLGAQDCEPQTAPAWCLFQALDPASTKGNIIPLTFDRPVKAVFSADGGTAYILNCGPECGGTRASVTQLPIAPMIFLLGQASGLLPSTTTPSTLCGTVNLATGCVPTPGGASNALVDSSTLYVVGQEYSGGYWGGNLTRINLSTNTVSAPAVSISDGAPGAVSRMIEADDDTLWIGMTKCNTGVRAAAGQPYGCLTMYNLSTNAVTLMPYNNDATGIAAVSGLHKIYTAEGGQIYIYSTVDGTAIDNQFVTESGTSYDVAYMDGLTDANNTVY